MIDEFLSTEKAKSVLDDIDTLMREFLNSRSINASIVRRRYPFSLEYSLGPLAVTELEWERFYRNLCDSVHSITNVTNAKEKLSPRQALHGQVFGEPIYRWQSTFLMTDLHTGKTPGITTQQTLEVSFNVPHSVVYK